MMFNFPFILKLFHFFNIIYAFFKKKNIFSIAKSGHYARNSQQLFSAEKHNMTFHQTKIDKLKCHKIKATYKNKYSGEI